jgi:hypothetical protein
MSCLFHIPTAAEGCFTRSCSWYLFRTRADTSPVSSVVACFTEAAGSFETAMIEDVFNLGTRKPPPPWAKFFVFCHIPTEANRSEVDQWNFYLCYEILLVLFRQRLYAFLSSKEATSTKTFGLFTYRGCMLSCKVRKLPPLRFLFVSCSWLEKLGSYLPLVFFCLLHVPTEAAGCFVK